MRVTAQHTIAGQTADGDSAEGSGTTNLAALAGLRARPAYGSENEFGETDRLEVSWTAFGGAEKYRVQWKTGSGGYNTGQETTRASHAHHRPDGRHDLHR